MKKLLLSLAVWAMATPCFADPISINDWAALGATGIVVGDKAFVYETSTLLSGTNASVSIANLGVYYQLYLQDLSLVQSGFSLHFTVNVIGTEYGILGTFVGQDEDAGNPTTSTLSSSGAISYTDNLDATNFTGEARPFFLANSVHFETTATTTSTDIMNYVTYVIVQEAFVPEPSTFVLAGLAVAGLVIARRRGR